MQVQAIMTRNPVVIPPDMTVEATAQLLSQRRISAAFVVDAGKHLLGVVSEGDLVRCLAPEGEEADLSWLARQMVNADHAAARYVKNHGRRVRDIMSNNVATIDEAAPVAEAAELMQKRHVRRLAVLRNGQLVGVVSRADLLWPITLGADRIDVSRIDQRIQQAILTELRRHPWANENLTSVIVRDGVVRFEGYCRSDEARRALSVIAERIEGVRQIEDKLEIGPLFDYPIYPPI